MSQVVQAIDRILPANFTTTSTTYVAVTGSELVHVFSKPNAMVRYSNISGSNSGVSQETFAKASIQGLGADVEFLYRTLGTATRQGSAMAVFSGLTPGSKTVRLEALVSGATGTISSAMRLGLEIIEWD